MRTAIFRKQHTAIRELLHSIPIKDVVVAPSAFATLVRLTATIRAHLKLEDAELYPVLLKSPDSHIRTKAAQFQKEMGNLAGAYIAFSETWISSRAIEADTRGFLNEWSSIVRTLTSRMDREDGDLYDEFDRLQAA
jgi:hypothetical protein